MTASAGAWYRVGAVNVVSGQQAVTGVGSNWQNDVTAIAVGDIFTLDAKTWYEVIAVNSDTSITLDRGFEGSTQNAANYAIVRNTSGTILTRVAGQIAVQFNQKQLFLDELRKWLNSDNALEELTDSHGVKKSLKTPAQMVRDHNNKLAEIDAIHPFPWAMRKVEFEAMRAANNEKYAADGWVHFGKHRDSGNDFKAVNEGLYAYTLGVDMLFLGRSSSVSNTEGESKEDFPVLMIGGVITSLIALSASDVYGAMVKLPPAEDGTRTYDTATGESVIHATPALAFAAETATNKVVTDRVDMWAFKGGLREINEADPSVYKHGLKQSTASNIDGVPTSANTTMPDSYFAWYEGDTSSRGNDVNWLTATELERIAIASNPKNNIFFDDETGKFYQWTVQGLSWAGLGNGDWQYIDVQTTATLRFDINHAITDADNGYYLGLGNGKYNHENIGSYQKYKSNAHTGEYLLVGPPVNRLNKGAYHPSFNPFGAAKWRDARSGSSVLNSSATWDDIINPVCVPTEKAQAFDLQPTGGVPTPCASSTSGFIDASAGSGRPDGRYYDAIYANGQGGVCRDMRYSASGLTAEDFAEEDLKIKSGEYRGREKLVHTIPVQGGTNGKENGFGIYHHDSLPSNNELWIISDVYLVTQYLQVGDKFTVVHSSGEVVECIARAVYSTRVVANYTGSVSFRQYSSGDHSSTYIFFHRNTTLSVAGEYLHTEVFGHPANILLCDNLKGGWVGSWNPTMPEGTSQTYTLTKPQSGTPRDTGFSAVVTHNNGGDWTSTHGGNLGWNSVTNSATFSTAATAVIVANYFTKAKVTEPTSNTEVYSHTPSSGVWYLMRNQARRGSGLMFSLTGLIPSSSGVGNYTGVSGIKNLFTDPETGKLSVYTEHTHEPLELSAPSNLGPAVKALNYNVVKNQQGFINYAYTQLTYDETAGDWGDDSKIHIADNQTTMLDENGHTNLVGIACSVEPLGWLKNDK